MEGHLPALQLLLDRGADIEAKDKVSQTNPHGRDKYTHITHTHTHIFTYIHTYKYIYTHTYTHTYTHIHIIISM